MSKLVKTYVVDTKSHRRRKSKDVDGLPYTWGEEEDGWHSARLPRGGAMNPIHDASATSLPKSAVLFHQSSSSHSALPVHSSGHPSHQSLASGASATAHKDASKERSPKGGPATDSGKAASTTTLAKSTTPSQRSSSSHSAMPVHSPRHSSHRSVSSGVSSKARISGSKEHSAKEGHATEPGKDTSTHILAKSTTPSHRSSSSHSALPGRSRRHPSRRSLATAAYSRAHMRSSGEHAATGVEGNRPEENHLANFEMDGKDQRRSSCTPAKPSDTSKPAATAASPTSTVSASVTSPESRKTPSAEKETTSNLGLTPLASWISGKLKKRKPKKSPPSRQAACIVLATVLLVLAVAVAVAVYYRYSPLSGGQRFGADDHGVCASADCKLHASFFRRRLDTRIDPCADFDAYVCSLWSPSSGLARDLVEEMALSWTLKAAWLLTKETSGGRHDANGSYAHDQDEALSAGRRAAAAFVQKCIAQKDDDADSLRMVRRFAASIGIPWPYDESATRHSAHPFAVLVKLDGLWGLELWSQTVVLKNNGGKANPPMLVIRKTGMAAAWLDFVDLLDKNGGRRAYYKEIQRLYGLPVPSEATMTAHLVLERAVLTTLAASVNETGREAVYTTVARLESLFSNLNGYPLSRTILSVFKSSGIVAQSGVYITDRHFLAATDWLLGKYSRRQLLEHIAWWFAQICVVMASRKARMLVMSSEDGSRMLKTSRCLETAAAWFGPALYYMSDAEDFAAERREGVDRFLRGLTAQTQRALAATTWVDEHTRRVMEQRLRDLRVVAWMEQLESSGGPPQDQSWGSFSNYWYDPKKEFLENWIAAAGHRLREKGAAGLLREEKYWLASPYQGVLYAYLTNLVKVSHAALSGPLFYAQKEAGVLRAASFGGLATAFLDAALRMFDLRGIRLEGGQPRSWMSPFAEQQLYKRLRCSSVNGENLLQVASLRVAWDAYKNDSGDLMSGEQLGILDWSGRLQLYTPDQIFFLTYCLRFCNTGINCGAAVRSLPYFGTAFGCGKRLTDEDEKNQCRFFP
ncbi:hypothetical protein V5799_006654 [Amblyomma americanum]|uniref:Peptidase M13 N-terminal domain-containing protein n=1 Tax=Amblyomma americanum TaxID=6943 RepID=A0AAQ4DVR8_AMBAM